MDSFGAHFAAALAPMLGACEEAVSAGVARGGVLLGTGVARLASSVGLLRDSSTQEQRDAAMFMGGASMGAANQGRPLAR